MCRRRRRNNDRYITHNSVKYERVYLKAYDSVSQARADIADYLNWYNTQRPHSRLERLTPNEKYFGLLPALPKAA